MGMTEMEDGRARTWPTATQTRVLKTDGDLGVLRAPAFKSHVIPVDMFEIGTPDCEGDPVGAVWRFEFRLPLSPRSPAVATREEKSRPA